MVMLGKYWLPTTLHETRKWFKGWAIMFRVWRARRYLAALDRDFGGTL